MWLGQDGHLTLKFTREELQEAFDALFEESLMIATRDKEVNESLKKLTLEKEAVELEIVQKEIKMASLQWET